MSMLFDRFREPHRGRAPQVKPLLYRRRERWADRRAGKADGLSMLPTDVVNPEPTPTINERIAEFVNVVTAELMSCLDDTKDWYAELAKTESEIEAAKDALAAEQQRWEAAGQPSINGSVDVWRIDMKGARLHQLRGTRQERIAKIEEREKQYHTVRNMHGAHALRRMHTYATVLRRVHPYGEQLGDVVHQLMTVEHERALRQLIELEQRIRGDAPRIATVTSLEGK